MSQDLLTDVSEGVGTITLNRPDSLNALSTQMNEAAREALAAWATDAKVRCIVITGAGRGFCSGGDIGSMSAGQGGNSAPLTLEERIDYQRRGQELSRLVHASPKVVIAALNGAAAGAGLGIALACDMRYASARAKITTAFAKVAFGGDYGITWGLTSLVGPAKAKELLILSDVLTAEQALAAGLVNDVFAEDDFQAKVGEIAARVAAGPLVSYRWMKENVNLAVHSTYHQLLDRESFTHLRCGETADHKEGVAAFMEKRAPSFQGR